MKRLIGSILACAALVCLQTASLAAQVTVFAAASLTDSLQEIAGAYEKASGDKIVFNIAASGVLARQIEEGAPADLFFSADEARADALETNGLLVKGTRTNLLANSLVIVTAADSATVRSPGDLTNAAVQRVALGLSHGIVQHHRRVFVIAQHGGCLADRFADLDRLANRLLQGQAALAAPMTRCDQKNHDRSP